MNLIVNQTNFGLIKKELYSKLIQEWLDYNDIFKYSTHNESKSVMAERFTKTLKSKTYKK